jgi:hypothetical protein
VGNLVRSELRLLSKHVVYTEFFGVADSSAAFGVGMTRTIEQGDPESFQQTVKPPLTLLHYGAAGSRALSKRQ